jgi:uncharacterized protein YdhG (YjbR/CyaY superfamily)
MLLYFVALLGVVAATSPAEIGSPVAESVPSFMRFQMARREPDRSWDAIVSESCRPMQKRNVPPRPSTRKRGAATKVDDYIAAVPNPALGPLRLLRATIRSVVPRDAREVISYRIPAFKRARVLVWYAAFAHHVSLFPGGSVLARFEDDLREYKTSRGTVQFPLDRPLPIPLIKRIVKARILEVEGKRS